MKFKKVSEFIFSEKMDRILVFTAKTSVLMTFISAFICCSQLNDCSIIDSSLEFHSGFAFGVQTTFSFMLAFYGLIRIPVLAVRLLRSFGKENKVGEKCGLRKLKEDKFIENETKEEIIIPDDIPKEIQEFIKQHRRYYEKPEELQEFIKQYRIKSNNKNLSKDKSGERADLYK